MSVGGSTLRDHSEVAYGSPITYAAMLGSCVDRTRTVPVGAGPLARVPASFPRQPSGRQRDNFGVGMVE
jgi:hypothetical protein